MKRVAIVGVLLFVAQHAGAQCLGDFNGDGTVSINELIIAVNNALNGCQNGEPTQTPTPMPTSCPIDFSDDNSQQGTPDCFYMGPWNATCGANDLQTHWISRLHDPTNPTSIDIVVVELVGFNPPLFYGAGTTSPTTAELIGWYRQPNASDLHMASGSLTLGASGSTLEMVPDAVPFQVDGCDFVHYDGSLIEVSQASAQTAAALPQNVDPAALERLRAASAERVPRPNFERQ